MYDYQSNQLFTNHLLLMKAKLNSKFSTHFYCLLTLTNYWWLTLVCWTAATALWLFVSWGGASLQYKQVSSLPFQADFFFFFPPPLRLPPPSFSVFLPRKASVQIHRCPKFYPDVTIWFELTTCWLVSFRFTAFSLFLLEYNFTLGSVFVLFCF